MCKWTRRPFWGTDCRRESLKVLVGLAFCEMLSQYPRSAFQGLCGGHWRGSVAVCDPNPPRPFARYRLCPSFAQLAEQRIPNRTCSPSVSLSSRGCSPGGAANLGRFLPVWAPHREEGEGCHFFLFVVCVCVCWCVRFCSLGGADMGGLGAL